MSERNCVVPIYCILLQFRSTFQLELLNDTILNKRHVVVHRTIANRIAKQLISMNDSLNNLN